jgi:multiple sugar transport system permease protein
MAAQSALSVSDGRDNTLDQQHLFLRRFNQVLLYLALLLAAVIFVVPILWLIVTSFKSNSEIGAIPFQFLPSEWRFQNYVDAVTRFPFLPAMGQSIITALLSSIPLVISSSMVGFGFARHRAPGRNALFIVMLAMIMVPTLVTMIPQFIIYARLGMINTYWPWFIGGLAGSPFFIFLFRQFFLSIPKELEEAAELDGCNRFQIYWRIFMPNATPVIAATFIFAFLGNWSDFLSPKLFLSESQATLASRLASAYVDPAGNPLQAETMAAIVVYVLPLILIYIVGQRYMYQISIQSGLK